MKSTSIRFGFDLDNTLIDYSGSVLKYCQAKNLKNCFDIETLRQLLRELDTTNHEWQVAQCWLYTTGLNYAKFADGAIDFIDYLHKKDVSIYIISHKTEFTPDFCGRKNLRYFASTWLENNGITNILPSPRNLYFENTRQDKITQINRLNLRYFVDDLFDVLDDPNISQSINKYLIGSQNFTNDSIKCAQNFIQLKEMVSNEF